MRRFNVRGNLSPRYIGCYEILKKLNVVAYRMDLPAKIKHVHYVLHIFPIRNYVPNPNHAIVTEPIKVAKNLVYETYHV